MLASSSHCSSSSSSGPTETLMAPPQSPPQMTFSELFILTQLQQQQQKEQLEEIERHALMAAVMNIAPPPPPPPVLPAPVPISEPTAQHLFLRGDSGFSFQNHHQHQQHQQQRHQQHQHQNNSLRQNDFVVGVNGFTTDLSSAFTSLVQAKSESASSESEDGQEAASSSPDQSTVSLSTEPSVTASRPASTTTPPLSMKKMSPTSKISKASSKAGMPFTLPEKCCTICRIDEATVAHFGVDICTGCRAFFRRSVAQQKIYRCLNSKLCGKNNLVPSRRCCKYCRFARCIQAGLLASKEQLYDAKLDCTGAKASMDAISTNLASKFMLPSSGPNLDGMPTTSGTTDSILECFVHFRRKMAYDILQTYYVNRTTPDEDIPIDCRQTVELGLRETDSMVKALGRSPVFDGVNEADRQLLFSDYSVVWTVLSQCFATVKHGGHTIKKMYISDGSAVRLNEDMALQYWAPIFGAIRDNRPVVIEMVARFLLSLALYTTCEVSSYLANAGLNDEELAAFTALLFFRPEVLSQTSEETRKLLFKKRQNLLTGLSTYLQSTGQKVEERMPTIIFLLSEFQTAIRMLKHGINIIRATTVAEILPDSYFVSFEEGAKDITMLLKQPFPLVPNASSDAQNDAEMSTSS